MRCKSRVLATYPQGLFVVEDHLFAIDPAMDQNDVARLGALGRGADRRQRFDLAPRPVVAGLGMPRIDDVSLCRHERYKGKRETDRQRQSTYHGGCSYWTDNSKGEAGRPSRL